MNRIGNAVGLVVIVISACGLCTAILDVKAAAKVAKPTSDQPAASGRWQHITIHRTFSDIDGREVTVPAVYVREETELGGMLQTRYDGRVIARQLPSGEWLIKVGDKELKTRDKRESVTYVDLGPSPDNPGAIR